MVTSHDPFDASQLQLCLHPPVEMPRYKSALALDALLEGHWEAVVSSLELLEKPRTLRAAPERRKSIVVFLLEINYELSGKSLYIYIFVDTKQVDQWGYAHSKSLSAT